MHKLTHFALASALALSLATGATYAAEKPAAKPAAAAPYKWPGLPPGAIEEIASMRDGTHLPATSSNLRGPVHGPWS